MYRFSTELRQILPESHCRRRNQKYCVLFLLFFAFILFFLFSLKTLNAYKCRLIEEEYCAESFYLFVHCRSVSIIGRTKNDEILCKAMEMLSSTTQKFYARQARCTYIYIYMSCVGGVCVYARAHACVYTRISIFVCI